MFWVDASSFDSISMSLKAASAQAFRVNGSVESVLQWIAHIQKEWLIVFDNANDPFPEMLAKFIPPGNRGNILVTSRNKSMGRVMAFKNLIEIEEMEESDAITLLFSVSDLDPSAEHIQAAKGIVAELGYIPLAIDQAGAYIKAGRCDITEYLRQFSIHRQTLMSDATFKGASGYDQTVYGTWDLSFKEMEKRVESTTGNAQAAQAAILILQICAFYHRSNISKDIFQSAAEVGQWIVDSDIAEKLPQTAASLDHTLLALDKEGHWDAMIFEEGISMLLSFSLMKRGQSSQVLSMNPLVHAWSQDRMSKSEQRRLCQIGSTILSCAIPQRFASEDYKLRRLIYQHIMENESYAYKIGVIQEYYDDKWSNFALVMKENGNWKNAQELEIKVMDMRKELLGAEHPYTLRSMASLAVTYRDQGKWNEAEQLEIQVMDKRKELLGAEHLDTLESMGNLASTYRNKGRWNEAEELEVQVMDMRKKLLGAEHPDTLESMGNLAATYGSQGRWIEAEELEVEVMDMRKELLGADHPETLTSMGNLAATYGNQGRWSEAEQLEVQVMDMTKKVLGAEHPDTLSSMANLAATYGNQGRWNEEEQLEVQVMDKRKKLLGAEHPDTLSSMANLVATYRNQERWNEAEQLNAQVMDMRKKLLGTEHPDTLSSMGNLAVICRNQGRWSKA